MFLVAGEPGTNTAMLGIGTSETCIQQWQERLIADGGDGLVLLSHKMGFGIAAVYHDVVVDRKIHAGRGGGDGSSVDGRGR